MPLVRWGMTNVSLKYIGLRQGFHVCLPPRGENVPDFMNPSRSTRNQEPQSTAFVSCNFRSLILQMKAPCSDEFRPFRAERFGDGESQLPAFIAYQEEYATWGYGCDTSENHDKYGLLHMVDRAIADGLSIATECLNWAADLNRGEVCRETRRLEVM